MVNLALLTIVAAAAATPPPTFTLLPHQGSMPHPTRQQLEYQGSMSALIHFGMATFFHDGDPGCTATNWNGCDKTNGTACNSSLVSSFAPSNLNMSSWIQSMKDVGITSAVLTAKHGCGFLGWQTKTSLPPDKDGKLSPYRYHVPHGLNVLEQFVAATEAAGIGHGFYYSLTNNFYLNVAGHVAKGAAGCLPGQACITQAQFETLALAQVNELWTEFGALTEIWLDGGCGAMCDKVAALVKRTKAEDAVAFNGGGVSNSPVRWCGTESGDPTKGPGGAVWSTTACPDRWCGPGSGSGDLPNSTGAIWYPSGVDVTLQAGGKWFFTPGDGIRPLSELAAVYHNSVGANGHLEIDFAIDRTGGIDPAHAAGYKAFGDWIRSCYGSPVAQGSLPAGETSFTVTLGSSCVSVDRVRMEEDQTAGQVIVDYVVEAKVQEAWVPFSAGTSIGAKRIDVATSPVGATALRFSVKSGFGKPTGLKLFAFAPAPCAL